jgi:hypothetical protein
MMSSLVAGGSPWKGGRAVYRNCLTLSRWITFCVMFAFPATSVAASDAEQRLNGFLQLHKCPVYERLLYTHQNGNKEFPNNRYVIFASRERTYAFVQCILFENDEKVLCEAASGFFSGGPGKPRTFRLSPRSLAAVQRFGFLGTGESGNHRQEFNLKDRGGLDGVADLIVRSLYIVYAPRKNEQMEYKAPISDALDPSPYRCTPIS